MRRLYVASMMLFMLSAHAAPASAQSTDEQAVRDVVVRLFDGMRARDTVMMRSVFHDEARFYGLDREGKVAVTLPEAFFRSIAAAPAGMVLDEVLHDVEVRIDGPLAAVWTYYDFFAGDRFSHCGYDALNLLKVGGEWKIVALADSRRSTDCRQQRG